ncbi:MAG: SRPBCC domain-containing protein [Myxococcaceae bacterium]|nr:SRPBCC domain-containing protein [Myxococcaceae bacterium]MCI0669645.1 SRPBCC domain-containing protein [Myxococcaceae bacterium]
MNPIAHELHIQGTPDEVFHAVSTTEGLNGWWAKDGRAAAQVGGLAELRFDKGGRVVPMTFRIDALEPGRRVAWTCTQNGNPEWIGTTLTWELEAASGGNTTLRFVHAGFQKGASSYNMTADGWKHFMSSIKAFVETGTGQPW